MCKGYCLNNDAKNGSVMITEPFFCAITAADGESFVRKSLTESGCCGMIINDAESRNHPFLTLRRKWLLVAVIER